MRTLGCLSALALICATVPAHAATPPQIGTAAVTQNDVSGTLGRDRRALKRGDGVFQSESIVIGKGAGAQILFRDETALTMVPESRVTLDKLVYDPDKKIGEMTLRATSGAFRFVTGSGPKAGYKIETPLGTIGVRGSIFQFWIRGQRLVLQLDEGGAYFCGATKCVELNQPGTYVVVTGTQVGNSQSKYGKECGSGGGAHCYITDGADTLFVDFLGLGRILNELSPGAGPPAPGNGPPPPGPPPVPGSFSPMINPGVGLPPGLDRGGPLPPGLAGRCAGGSCTAPGPQNVPPGQLKKK